MSRAQALDLAAGVIARHVPDLAHLIDLLEIAGQRRLATALRGHLAQHPVVTGAAKPDASMWLRGRL
jgi:hypothetical protein